MKLLLLLALVAAATAVPRPIYHGDTDHYVPVPECKERDSFFPVGTKTTYRYEGYVDSGVVGTTTSTSGLKYKCQVDVSVPDPCHYVVETPRCSLYHHEGVRRDPEAYVEDSRSGEFSEHMSRYPVYFQMTGGNVTGVIVYDDEPVYISNIKRGIISAFQLQTGVVHNVDAHHVNEYGYNVHYPEVDVHGNCTTHYKVDDTRPEYVYTYKNFETCHHSNHRNYQHYQYSTFSYFQNMSFVQHLFNSTVKCEYRVNYDDKEYKEVHCYEYHHFKPYQRDYYTGVQANVSYHLYRGDVSRQTTPFEKSLSGRRYTTLEYVYEHHSNHIYGSYPDYQQHSDYESRRYGVHERVPAHDRDGPHEYHDYYVNKGVEFLKHFLETTEQRVQTYTPSVFVHFIDYLRQQDYFVIRDLFYKSQDCNSFYRRWTCDDTHKEIVKSYMIDALVQTNTHPSVRVLREVITKGYVSTLYANTIFYSYTFHNTYDPYVIREFLEICKVNTTRPCLLSLSTIVHQYVQWNHSVSHGDVVPQVVVDTIEYLQELLGHDCSVPHEEDVVVRDDRRYYPQRTQYYGREYQEYHYEQDFYDRVILALKSIGNLGSIVQQYDKVYGGEHTTQETIFRCATSVRVPYNVSIEAIRATRRFKPCERTRQHYMNILQNTDIPVEHRIAAYLGVMRMITKPYMKEILYQYEGEHYKQVKSYIASHIHSILSSHDPQTAETRSIILECVDEDDEPLPEFNYKKFSKYSRHYEFSNYFKHPFFERVGGSFDTDVIYDPESYVPHHVMFNTTLHALGYNFNLFETGVDVRGVERYIESVFGPHGYFPDKPLYNIFRGINVTQFFEQYYFGRQTSDPVTGSSHYQSGRDTYDGPRYGGRDTHDGPRYGGREHHGRERGGKYDYRDDEVYDTTNRRRGGRYPRSVDSRGVYDNEVIDNIEQIHDDVKHEEYDPFASIYFKIFGHELGYTNAHDIKYYFDYFRKHFDYRGMVYKLQRGYHFDVNKAVRFLEGYYVVPTGLGVPFNVSANATAVVSVKNYVQADLSRVLYKGNQVFGTGHVKPSVVLEFTNRFTVGIPYYREVGVQTNSTIYSNFEIKGNFTYKNKDFHVYVDTPHHQWDLFNYTKNLYLIHDYTGNQYEYVQGNPEYNKYVRRCTTDTLSRVSGLEVCRHTYFQNTSYVDVVPQFPITGHFSYNFTVKPFDPELKYVHFHAHYNPSGYYYDRIFKRFFYNGDIEERYPHHRFITGTDYRPDSYTYPGSDNVHVRYPTHPERHPTDTHYRNNYYYDTERRCSYKQYEDTHLPGHNVKDYSGYETTLEGCLNDCSRFIECLSVEFRSVDSKCFHNTANSFTVPVEAANTDEHREVYYEKTKPGCGIVEHYYPPTEVPSDVEHVVHDTEPVYTFGRCSYKKFVGKELKGYNIHEYDGYEASVEQCLNDCSRYVECHSVDYAPGEGRCWHNTGNSFSVGIVDADVRDDVYYEKTQSACYGVTDHGSYHYDGEYLDKHGRHPGRKYYHDPTVNAHHRQPVSQDTYPTYPHHVNSPVLSEQYDSVVPHDVPDRHVPYHFVHKEPTGDGKYSEDFTSTFTVQFSAPGRFYNRNITWEVYYNHNTSDIEYNMTFPEYPDVNTYFFFHNYTYSPGRYFYVSNYNNTYYPNKHSGFYFEFHGDHYYYDYLDGETKRIVTEPRVNRTGFFNYTTPGFSIGFSFENIKYHDRFWNHTANITFFCNNTYSPLYYLHPENPVERSNFTHITLHSEWYNFTRHYRYKDEVHKEDIEYVKFPDYTKGYTYYPEYHYYGYTNVTYPGQRFHMEHLFYNHTHNYTRSYTFGYYDYRNQFRFINVTYHHRNYSNYYDHHGVVGDTVKTSYPYDHYYRSEPQHYYDKRYHVFYLTFPEYSYRIQGNTTYTSQEYNGTFDYRTYFHPYAHDEYKYYEPSQEYYQRHYYGHKVHTTDDDVVYEQYPQVPRDVDDTYYEDRGRDNRPNPDGTYRRVRRSIRDYIHYRHNPERKTDFVYPEDVHEDHDSQYYGDYVYPPHFYKHFDNYYTKFFSKPYQTNFTVNFSIRNDTGVNYDTHHDNRYQQDYDPKVIPRVTSVYLNVTYPIKDTEHYFRFHAKVVNDTAQRGANFSYQHHNDVQCSFYNYHYQSHGHFYNDRHGLHNYFNISAVYTPTGQRDTKEVKFDSHYFHQSNSSNVTYSHNFTSPVYDLTYVLRYTDGVQHSHYYNYIRSHSEYYPVVQFKFYDNAYFHYHNYTYYEHVNLLHNYADVVADVEVNLPTPPTTYTVTSQYTPFRAYFNGKVISRHEYVPEVTVRTDYDGYKFKSDVSLPSENKVKVVGEFYNYYRNFYVYGQYQNSTHPYYDAFKYYFNLTSPYTIYFNSSYNPEFYNYTIHKFYENFFHFVHKVNSSIYDKEHVINKYFHPYIDETVGEYLNHTYYYFRYYRYHDTEYYYKTRFPVIYNISNYFKNQTKFYASYFYNTRPGFFYNVYRVYDFYYSLYDFDRYYDYFNYTVEERHYDVYSRIYSFIYKFYDFEWFYSRVYMPYDYLGVVDNYNFYNFNHTYDFRLQKFFENYRHHRVPEKRQYYKHYTSYDTEHYDFDDYRRYDEYRRQKTYDTDTSNSIFNIGKYFFKTQEGSPYNGDVSVDYNLIQYYNYYFYHDFRPIHEFITGTHSIVQGIYDIYKYINFDKYYSYDFYQYYQDNRFHTFSGFYDFFYGIGDFGKAFYDYVGFTDFYGLNTKVFDTFSYRIYYVYDFFGYYDFDYHRYYDYSGVLDIFYTVNDVVDSVKSYFKPEDMKTGYGFYKQFGFTDFFRQFLNFDRYYDYSFFPSYDFRGSHDVYSYFYKMFYALYDRYYIYYNYLVNFYTYDKSYPHDYHYGYQFDPTFYEDSDYIRYYTYHKYSDLVTGVYHVYSGFYNYFYGFYDVGKFHDFYFRYYDFDSYYNYDFSDFYNPVRHGYNYGDKYDDYEVHSYGAYHPYFFPGNCDVFYNVYDFFGFYDFARFYNFDRFHTKHYEHFYNYYNHTANFTSYSTPQVIQSAVHKVLNWYGDYHYYKYYYDVNDPTKYYYDYSYAANITHNFYWKNFTTIPVFSNYTAYSVRKVFENFYRKYDHFYRGLPRYHYYYPKDHRDYHPQSFGFYHRYQPKTVKYSPSYPSYAMVFGPHHVYTWDHRYYEHPGYHNEYCTYLLAHDFKDKNFTILGKEKSITVITPEIAVTIDDYTKVYVNESRYPSELPIQSYNHNVYVTREGPYIYFHSTYGVYVVCNPHEQYCLFNISGYYHNRTLGVLGTNDREPYTDFKLRDGTITHDVNTFVNDYEVSGDRSCYHEPSRYVSAGVRSPYSVDTSSVSSSGCYSPPSSKCDYYFSRDNYLSPYYHCFRRVNPEPFRQACYHDTSLCDVDTTPEKAICHTSSAYTAICNAKGVYVNNTYECTYCEDSHHLGDTWTETEQREVDVVFVVSLHHSTFVDSTPTFRLKNLVQTTHERLYRAGYGSVRYGVTAYGGDGVNYQPHSHTIHGELFTDVDDIWKGFRTLETRGHNYTDAFTAIRFAARTYPFRPEAARIFVLITPHERDYAYQVYPYHHYRQIQSTGYQQQQDTGTVYSRTPAAPKSYYNYDYYFHPYYTEPEVYEYLRKNGIVLNVISDYPSVDKSRYVYGVNYDGSVFTDKKTEKISIPFPTGDYATVARETHGSVFLRDQLMSPRNRPYLYSFADAVVTQVHRVSGYCKVCYCVVGRGGEPVSECRYTPCHV